MFYISYNLIIWTCGHMENDDHVINALGLVWECRPCHQFLNDVIILECAVVAIFTCFHI